MIGRLLALGLVLGGGVACASTAAEPADSGSAGSAGVVSSSSGGELIELTVQVGLFGGPMRPDGTMAEVNAPAQGIAVTVTGAGSVIVRRTTGPDGTAVFHVAPGRWTVSSTCGNPQTLDVPQSVVASVQCDVP
jgi:hypothetical protein